MTLAFYRVRNSQDYFRHTFDNMDGDEVFNKLSLLDNDEVRTYDFERSLDVIEFENDYNDDILDGGWWCVVID